MLNQLGRRCTCRAQHYQVAGGLEGNNCSRSMSLHHGNPQGRCVDALPSLLPSARRIHPQIAPQKDFRKVLEVVSNVKKQAHKQQLQQQQAAHQGAKPGAGGHRSQVRCDELARDDSILSSRYSGSSRAQGAVVVGCRQDLELPALENPQN